MKSNNRLVLLDTSLLADENLFARYYDEMSQERKNKIDKIKAEGAKRLSLGAGILLKKALDEARIMLDGECEGEKIAVQLGYGPQGKPYIAGCDDFFFNRSHSGSMVAIAVSDREVGVDIQKLKHFEERLASYVFNIEDREFAKGLPARCEIAPAQICDGVSDMDYIYTRMWAMKESVMKYNGKGLAMEPQKIALKMDDGTAIRVSHPAYDCSRLFISDYSCSVGADGAFYGLAVCSDYEDFGEIELFSLSK